MSTTTAATPATPAGDICPPWCGGKHLVDREENTHEDDRGSLHDGNTLDAWEPEGADKTLEVRLHGYRHDNGNDWPDTVVAENTSPGFMGGVELQASDARRLARALLAGAAQLEATGVSAPPSCPSWCSDHMTGDDGNDGWHKSRGVHVAQRTLYLTDGTLDGEVKVALLAAAAESPVTLAEAEQLGLALLDVVAAAKTGTVAE